MDLNKKYRPKHWSNLIGQSDIIDSLLLSYCADKFPDRMIFVGPAGCGKSSAAELFGKLLMCENPTEDLNPCYECPSCKSNHTVRKFNMAEYNKNKGNYAKTEDKDVMEVYKEIFQFKALEGKACYILEEINSLSKENQQPFLEALTKQPEGVYIIACANYTSTLSEAFRNRFAIFNFGLPKTADCVNYAANLIMAEEHISVDTETLRDYVEILGNSPRSIAQYMSLFISNNYDVSVIRKILNHADRSHLDEYFKYLSPNKSESDLAIWLSRVEPDVLPKIIFGLRDYFMDCLMSLSDSKRAGLSDAALETLKEIGEKKLYNFIVSLKDIPRYSNMNSSDAMFHLMCLKLSNRDMAPAQPDTIRINVADAASETHMNSLEKSSSTVTTSSADEGKIAADFGEIDLTLLGSETFTE